MDWSIVAVIFTIIGVNVGIFSWLLSEIKEIRFEIKGIRSELKSDINELRNDNKDLRTSINRIEGALLSKDCCMLSDRKSNQKAE